MNFLLSKSGKRNWGYLACFLLLIFLPISSFGQKGNLAPNPGFEQGSKNWVIRTATLDESIKHGGKASLKYSNSDPDNYKVIVTHVPVKGGELLEFSAWVKGKNIMPAKFGDKGAGIYLHAYDGAEKSLGGSNPPTPSGTFDWTQVQGLFKVPPKARKIAISLYIVRGNTGTAWFDDVLVRPYSGELDIISKKKKIDKGSYIDEEGFTIKDGQRIFPFGIYLGKAQKQGLWDNQEHHFNQIKSAGFNTVLSYLHGDRKDGRAYLKLLENVGLNSIYSLSNMYDGNESFYPKSGQIASQRIGELVQELQSSPALLAWYTGDEISLSHVIEARKTYDIIQEKDGKHLVYQVANKKEMVPYLKGISDVMGMDPYPIGKKNTSPNLGLVGERTNYTVQQAGGDQGVWGVVQIFNKGYFQKYQPEDYKSPSDSEIRNMLFQTVINGARGVMFYAYHLLWFDTASGKVNFGEEVYQKQWGKISKISREFEAIIPVILANQVYEIPGLIKDEGINCKAWKYEGEVYLMAVNLSEKKGTLSYPDGKVLELESGGSLYLKL
ncbi:hypothetical protein LZF95_11460 [Algoriphagus sp. AGSA1]|uniref:hypothetical protein n=1 Tax=Algoriphagus sp. AGSA1 TaxID=2907213 RepID=UPI001F4181DD|nr:hypothetical protein [Algoriphagus sp. AGSA1]MCE7055294.1 hypothetical protein [Algoriphagus sp. AGSA1]